MQNHIHITAVGSCAMLDFQDLLQMGHKNAMINCFATVYDVLASPQPGLWHVKALACSW
jgi:hypothetical protein